MGAAYQKKGSKSSESGRKAPIDPMGGAKKSSDDMNKMMSGKKGMKMKMMPSKGRKYANGC